MSSSSNSHFMRQQQSFNASLASLASTMNPKRPVPASPSPSIASTTSAAAGGATPKKPKRDPAGTIFSQPENTGVGTDVSTQILYAVEYLKNAPKPLGLEKILDHLNLDRETEAWKRGIMERLRNHPRVEWKPEAGLSEQGLFSGTYEHKPIIPNVKTKEQLLAYLQNRRDASGVSVKELKDGWPDCEKAISQLEAEHKILVVRTKKDNHARMVWYDDPTLFHHVEGDFVAMWHKVEVPALDDIVRRLESVGQKPTSEDPRIKAAMQPQQKKDKKRVNRKSGKTTNAHMSHLLKDYSHLKK